MLVAEVIMWLKNKSDVIYATSNEITILQNDCL